MTNKHSLTVSNLRRLTDEAVELTLSIPDALQANFQFKHGQFVELTATIDGQQVSRNYSICSAPYEKELKVAIKQVSNGTFSVWANQALKQGDELLVSEPQGVFTSVLDSSQRKHYVLIAAGSGITPILSILKMVLAAESLSQCVLVYANKTPETTMFHDELSQLKSRYSDRFDWLSVYSQSDAGDYQGRVDQTVVTKLLGELSSVDEFFVCGPEAMSVPLYEFMLTQGLTEEQLHIELFTEVQLDADTDSGKAKIQLKIDGEELLIDYQDNTRSILDTALEYDSDLPYGCQNGSCGSCQAKLINGTVEMEVNYALSQSEVDEGYILMCQARPTSADVEIDYDA